MEGDGFLALETYKRVNALYITIQSKHMHNIAAMAKREASGNHVHEKQLLDYADTCLKPAYDYFKLKFDQDLKSTMNVFKAAHLFSPAYSMYASGSIECVSHFFHSVIEKLNSLPICLQHRMLVQR